MTAALFNWDTYYQNMVRVGDVLWVYSRRDGWVAVDEDERAENADEVAL